MKVAAIQFAPRLYAKPINLKKMKILASSAAAAGAKLIVLPELSTSGYSMMNSDEAKKMADVLNIDDNPNNSMSVMAQVAGQYGCAVVWGCIELDEGTGRVYNSQVFLEKREEGWYWESYRKINPWGQDYLWASRGNSNPPVVHSEVLDGKRVGLLICRDVRDKKDDEWSNFYSKGDADVVAFSSNFGKGGFPAVAWMDFAEENRVHLIVSNRYGIEENNDFGGGGICVISPQGKVTCEGLVWDQDCIVYAEI